MSLDTFLSTTAKTVQDNSPSILAALAVGGVATTGFLAYSAGRTYQSNLEALERETDEFATGKQKFELGWRRVALVSVVGGVAITCVIASTAINNRRNAALAGLVTLGEVTLREYKEKVREVVTKPKHDQVERELAQDKLDKVEDKSIVWMTDGEDIILFDTLTSRAFKSTQMSIQQAEIDMNRRILGNDYISQNEWYDAIGLPRTGMGDDFGWNHENPIEISFDPLLKEGKPVMGLRYRFPPISTFDR